MRRTEFLFSFNKNEGLSLIILFNSNLNKLVKTTDMQYNVKDQDTKLNTSFNFYPSLILKKQTEKEYGLKQYFGKT